MKGMKIFPFVTGVLGILVLSLFFSCTKPTDHGPVERLRVGVSSPVLCSLLYIAAEKGLFKRHGLDVTFEKHEAGAYAVNDLLAGKVDVATAAEFVLALQFPKSRHLRAVGSVSATDSIEVVVRKDHGIARPPDLKGKRVGVTKGTISEFFLSTFLSFNGLRSGDIQAFDLTPSEMVSSFAEGKIDAAVAFPPFLDAMKKRVGEEALSWPAQGGQAYTFLLICNEELIRSRPRAISSLLKGVLEAETFVENHGKEAQDIMATALNLSPETVSTTWAKSRFRVRLDQDLLTLMEDEARWAVRNKLIEPESVPNYFFPLYLDGLEQLKPGAVGVIH